jgi:hypothetical protein
MLSHFGVEVVVDMIMVELWGKATTLLVEDSVIQRIRFGKD